MRFRGIWGFIYREGVKYMGIERCVEGVFNR